MHTGLKNALGAAIIGFLFISAICLVSLAKSVNAIGQNLTNNANIMRDDLHYQLQEAQGILNRQLTAARKDAIGESRAYREMIDLNWARTVHALTSELDKQLTYTNESLDTTNTLVYNGIGAFLQSTVPVTDNLADITSKLSTQEPLIYSRYLAITGETMRTLDAFRRMSEEAAKAAPELTSDAKEITSNVNDITANVKSYTKPKGFFSSILPAAITGAVRAIF